MKNATPTLFDMKLAIVAYHNEAGMEYTMNSIARDACYTSRNSLDFKLKQIALNNADQDKANEDNHEILADRKRINGEKMEIELAHLMERHQADLAVHLEVVGEHWTKPTGQKPSVVSNLSKRAAEARKEIEKMKAAAKNIA